MDCRKQAHFSVCQKPQVGRRCPQTALCGPPRRMAWRASDCGSPSGCPRPRCCAPLSWFAGKCCGTRVRGSVPQPQSSSLALPCQILVSVDGCQSLAAFGSCIHWMRAPSRRPITPASASCTSTFLTLCSFFFFIFPGEACPTQKTAGTPKRWPRRRWPRWGWTGRTTRTARQRSTPWKRPARRAAPCGSS